MEKQSGKSGNNFWKDKRVFITGGTGFIGSWLVNKLVELNANVFCLSEKQLNEKSNFILLGLNKQVKLINGNVLDFELLNKTIKENEIEVVFHLAAQPLVQVAIKNPVETLKINIIGTANVLEACRLNNVKSTVVASTDKAYGEGQVPYKEDYCLNAKYPYDVSKSCADLIAGMYGKTYKLQIGIARFTNTYGPGDFNFDRIVPETIKSLIEGNDIKIRSNGKFKRDFIYVKDVVNAYLVLAEKTQELKLEGDAFNFGSGNPVLMIDLVNKILEFSGNKKSKINILNQVKSEIKDSYVSIEKASKILGWKPEYGLEQGLKETFKWYEKYFKL